MYLNKLIHIFKPIVNKFSISLETHTKPKRFDTEDLKGKNHKSVSKRINPKM